MTSSPDFAGGAWLDASAPAATVDSLPLEEWGRLIRERGAPSIFHSAEWLRMLESSYSHRPHCLGVVRGGRLEAGMALMEVRSWLTGVRGVCAPFSDFCEPFGAVGDLRSLLAAAVSLGRQKGWKYLEIRGLHEDGLFPEPSISYLGHEIDLRPEPEQILRTFHPSVKRALRKAESSALALEVGSSRAQLEDYYRLHGITRRRLGSPPQPMSFFESLRTRLLEPGHGFIVLARRNGVAVAGSVFLHACGQACYKFGASDERFQQFRGSNWVMWHGIQESRRRGCTSLHLGRTAPGAEGLRRYKLGFGARETAIRYFRLEMSGLSVDRVIDRSEGLPNQVFRRLPVWVSRLVGAAVYPHLS